MENSSIPLIQGYGLRGSTNLSLPEQNSTLFIKYSTRTLRALKLMSMPMLDSCAVVNVVHVSPVRTRPNVKRMEMYIITHITVAQDR
jgi:hypothetical protein